MASYRLRITRSAAREIDGLPGNVRQRIRRAVAQLATNPRPRDAKALIADLEGHWRLRLEAFRVIYRIDDEQRIVDVLRVARRSPFTYRLLD